MADPMGRINAPGGAPKVDAAVESLYIEREKRLAKEVKEYLVKIMRKLKTDPNFIRAVERGSFDASKLAFSKLSDELQTPSTDAEKFLAEMIKKNYLVRESHAYEIIPKEIHIGGWFTYFFENKINPTEAEMEKHADKILEELSADRRVGRVNWLAKFVKNGTTRKGAKSKIGSKVVVFTDAQVDGAGQKITKAGAKNKKAARGVLRAAWEYIYNGGKWVLKRILKR